MPTNSPVAAMPLLQPGKPLGLMGFLKYRYLLLLLVRKGTVTRYHGSVLGWAWSYVLPAAQFVVYYVVFGFLFQLKDGVHNFAIYLFSGIVAMNLFTEALRNSTTSIVDNRELVRKIYLPRELFPIASVIVSLIHFLPQAVILLFFSLILGWSFSWLQLLAFLLGILLVIILATGLGLFFGALNVAYRDANNFVGLLLMLVTWTSPVLYTWTLVQQAFPEWLFNLYLLNPLTIAVEMFHYAFWSPLSDGTLLAPPNFLQNTVYAFLVSVAFLMIGQMVFRSRERTFAQDL